MPSGQKALTECQGLGVSALQDRGVAAPICHNATTPLIIYGNMYLDGNKLKIHPIGMATLKKALV